MRVTETLEKVGRAVFPLSMFRIKPDLELEVPRYLQVGFLGLFISACIAAFAWSYHESTSSSIRHSAIVFNNTVMESQGYDCVILNFYRKEVPTPAILPCFPNPDDPFNWANAYLWDVYYQDYQSCITDIHRRIDNCDIIGNLTLPSGVDLDFSIDLQNCECFSQIKNDFAVQMCEPYKFFPPYFCKVENRLQTLAVFNSALNFVDFVQWIFLLIIPALIFLGKIVSKTKPKFAHLLIPESFFSFRQDAPLKTPHNYSWSVFAGSLLVVIAYSGYALSTFLNDSIDIIEYRSDFPDRSEDFKCKRIRFVGSNEIFEVGHQWISYTMENYGLNTSLCEQGLVDIQDINCIWEMLFRSPNGEEGDDLYYFETFKDCVNAMQVTPLDDCEFDPFQYSLSCKLNTTGGVLMAHFSLAPFISLDNENDTYVTLSAEDYVEQLSEIGFSFPKAACQHFADGLYPPFECRKQVQKYSELQKLSLLVSSAQFYFFISRVVLTFFALSWLNIRKNRKTYPSVAVHQVRQRQTALEKFIERITPLSLYAPKLGKQTIVPIKNALFVIIVTYVACLGSWCYLMLRHPSVVENRFLGFAKNDLTSWNDDYCVFLGGRNEDSAYGYFGDQFGFPYFGDITSKETFPSGKACTSYLTSVCYKWQEGWRSGGFDSLEFVDKSTVIRFSVLPDDFDFSLIAEIDHCKLFDYQSFCNWFSQPPAVCNVPKPPTVIARIGRATGLVELGFLVLITLTSFFMVMGANKLPASRHRAREEQITYQVNPLQ